MESLTCKNPISPIAFYGNKTYKKVICESGDRYKDQPVPLDLKRLLGPTSIWKVFKKQADLLKYVNNNKCDLMPFVFQQESGERLFLAAHPRWLWYYDSNKNQCSRCSYEIISEYTVCKLYFDLEFEVLCNPNSDGACMTDLFIKIVCFYIKLFWNLDIGRTNIIDLDSSTDSKFSRHLIFNSPNLVFRDNYNVGSFVKHICSEVKCCIELLENYSENHPLINKFIQDKTSLKSLKIKNSKDKSVIFCDEGVYTKNRHFRLFKSTKPRKNAPLVVSIQNLYKPNLLLENVEEQLFLDSLVSFLPNVKEGAKIIQFNHSDNESSPYARKISNVSSYDNCRSPFPRIDNFINKIVDPGRIWRNNYFQTSNMIVYDIIGNRYCGNIGKQHRSNNIKLIVDIGSRCYYQKCYDPECSNYRSQSYQFPPEVEFCFNDDFDNYISENTSFESSFNELDDSELFEIADIVEQIPSELIDE